LLAVLFRSVGLEKSEGVFVMGHKQVCDHVVADPADCCPDCRIEELEADVERLTAEVRFLELDLEEQEGVEVDLRARLGESRKHARWLFKKWKAVEAERNDAIEGYLLLTSKGGA